MIKKFASIVSTVFSPLLVPTYSVWLALSVTVLALAPATDRFKVVLGVFLLTCLMPAVLIVAMWKLGFVSEPGLNKRTERTVPYLITIAGYVMAAFFLVRVNAPLWLTAFLGGAALAALISMIVNRWWKISAHMAGVGGMLGLVTVIAVGPWAITTMVWWVAAAVLVCGLTGTSRLILRRHTMAQVAAGFVNGLLCVMTPALLLM